MTQTATGQKRERPSDMFKHFNVPHIPTEAGNSEARVIHKVFFWIKKKPKTTHTRVRTHAHTTTLFRMQRIGLPNPALNDKKKLRNQETKIQ